MRGQRASNGRALAVAAAVVVAAVVAGTAWAVAPPTPKPVGQDASERYAAIEGVNATKTVVVERGDETTRSVARVALRPGADARRVRVLESMARRYEVTVSNGSVLWLYDGDAATAKRIPLSQAAGERPTVGDRLERLFARLNVTTAGAPQSTAARGVSPLPVVPASGRTGPPTANRTLELRYDGTATVAGRETHVLELASGSGELRQTLWVDAEQFFVLKRHTEWVADGTPVAVTTTYSNVSFGPVDDAAFSFDPPANATVDAVETPESTVYERTGTLREDASIAVPEPSLPASFELTYATETTGRIHGVGLRYANATALVTVAKYDRTSPAAGDRTVDVADHDAAVSVGPTTSVSWNCGTFRYTVRGSGVPVDVLVAVARSVACE